MNTLSKKVILTVGLGVLFLLFNGCFLPHPAPRYTKITIESGQLPPAMATDSFILIGRIYEKESYDKYVRKEFAKYTGDYELATNEQIERTYWNTNEYRYILDYEYKSYYTSSDNSFNNLSFRYFIYDRKEDKKYLCKFSSSFFALEISNYLLAIEAVRKK